ncbi:MFS transporter [Bacillus niameyensis]|uniref:MFS transporter n=1 Tax=Bacillus niameyensis TaxID=1522308 RepID=UPI0007828830|nr:MFS transporter [Bacillus niameyensis]
MQERKPVIIVAIVTAICLLGDSMLYIVLPVFWKDAGLHSLWEVGILLSINRFVRLPLNPFIGWLYNKMTLRTGLIIAVIIGAMTTIGYGLFKGFLLWFILRALWGVAWSFLKMGGYFTVISYSNDGNRGQWMGSYNGISRLGSLAGMLAGGILVPIFGLQAVSILFGISIFIGIPLILIFISNKKVTENTHTERDWTTSIWSKRVVRVLVCGLSIALLQAIFTSTLSLIIDTNYSQSISIFGIVLSSTALAGILQSVRWVWEPFLATKIGRKSDGISGRVPLFLFSLICAAVGYSLIPWELPIYFWIIIVLFVMMTGTATQTLMDALASDTAKVTSVITVMTAYSVVTDLGSALGPMLTYWFVNMENGILIVYLCSAIIYLAIMLSYRPSSRTEKVNVPSGRV